MHNNFSSVTAMKNVPGLLLLACAAMAGLVAIPAFAQTTDAEVMDWWTMGMQLFGGLALFLFGMEQMADALKAVAGERMKVILAKLTTNRLMGAATGAFVTCLLYTSDAADDDRIV